MFPMKSAALAALVPEPVTAQLTLTAVVEVPERVTVNVNGVPPELPSARDALVAAIDRTVGGRTGTTAMQFSSGNPLILGPITLQLYTNRVNIC